MRIAILIQYDGSSYHGWQFQPEHETVQGVIESALHKLYGVSIGILGSGRTDSGVHALGQVAHFDVEQSAVPPENIWMALNQRLPDDIRIIGSAEVDAGFHSRFDALERSYEYQLTTNFNVLHRQSQWHVRYALDPELLQAMAIRIRGEHDFSSFCYAGTETENMICNIMQATWNGHPDHTLIFSIKGNRFLHHMVRMLVGSMVEVARGKWSMDRFEQLLLRPDRQAHAVTAPSTGLALVRVQYPRDLQPKWKAEYPNLASRG